MNSLTDQQLLRHYTESRSESAFAELVRRHIDLIYSAALRIVRDRQLAEDVTQGVFVVLARNNRQLTEHPVLSGWLHRTAQNIAAQTVRTDVRRRAREQEAATMNELLSVEPDTTWEHIGPHLDDALGELSESDRDALLLRYFERKSAREMAQTLGVSDEAAQKRVSRAVERLREFFAKRGVTVGASELVVVISANSVQAAPSVLAKTVTAVAIAESARVIGSTFSLIKGALKIMVWTKAKTAIVVGVGVLLVAGTTMVLVQKHIEGKQYSVAREPWSDAGASTPKAALQSLVWALTHDKIDRAEALMQWDEKGAQYSAKPEFEHEITLMSVLAPALKDIESFRILSIEPAKQPNEVKVTIEKSFKNNNIRPFVIAAKLRRAGGQWHIVGNIDYFEGGSASMLLPFTGSF